MAFDGKYVTGVPLVTDDDRKAVDAVLRSGWLGCGPQVASFEAELSRKCKQGEAVVVSSATAALALTLAAHGVGRGDEVITSALTFAATANAIVALGAKPVLVDTLPDGSSLDPDQVTKAAGPQLAAVVPVAWRGEPSDTATLREVCAQISAKTDRKIVLVEDGAYALGSDRDDVLAPSPATPVITSLHPTKIITAGLGGAVLGLPPRIAEAVRRTRNQGLDASAFARLGGSHYNVPDRGFALEMSDIHAALGRSQLSRLHDLISRRRVIFETLRQELDGSGIWCPSAKQVRFGTSNASLFAVLLEDGQDRDSVRQDLVTAGVLTSVQYPFLADMQTWKDVRSVSDLTYSRRLSNATLSLPSSPFLSEDDCREIAQIVRKVVSARK
jgi:dTDP-4-amino-4,6-dideoxygalactose transaminase